jgi:hypothetical protein
MVNNRLSSLILLLIFMAACSVQSRAQDSEARLLSSAEFQLSPTAAAAGIDGKMQIGMTIKADGTASDLRIYGGPMWPCGTDAGDQVENVRHAVKEYLLAQKWQPAMKNGKPKSSDVQITFMLSGRFRQAADTDQIEENLKKGINPLLVDIKNLTPFVISLPGQVMGSRSSISARLSEIQVLIDESGNVISAGGFRTAVTELKEARDLACNAKFKPLTLNQKPVKMTGIIMYSLY